MRTSVKDRAIRVNHSRGKGLRVRTSVKGGPGNLTARVPEAGQVVVEAYGGGVVGAEVAWFTDKACQ